jgi:hypothetical protein
MRRPTSPLAVRQTLRYAPAPSPTLPRERGRELSIAGKLAQPAQAWLHPKREGAPLAAGKSLRYDRSGRAIAIKFTLP